MIAMWSVLLNVMHIFALFLVPKDSMLDLHSNMCRLLWLVWTLISSFLLANYQRVSGNQSAAQYCEMVNSLGSIAQREHLFPLSWQVKLLYIAVCTSKRHIQRHGNGSTDLQTGCFACLSVKNSHSLSGDSRCSDSWRIRTAALSHPSPPLLFLHRPTEPSKLQARRSAELDRIRTLLGKENTIQKKINTKNKFLSHSVSSHSV